MQMSVPNWTPSNSLLAESTRHPHDDFKNPAAVLICIMMKLFFPWQEIAIRSYLFSSSLSVSLHKYLLSGDALRLSSSERLIWPDRPVERKGMLCRARRLLCNELSCTLCTGGLDTAVAPDAHSPCLQPAAHNGPRRVLVLIVGADRCWLRWAKCTFAQ